jgi:hypothetical protein
LKKFTSIHFNPLEFEKALNNENGFPIAVQNYHPTKKTNRWMRFIKWTIWVRERFYIKWTRENFFCTQSMVELGTNYGGRWFYQFVYLTLASEMGLMSMAQIIF